MAKKVAWRPVKGYEGKYEVSDTGEVYSEPRKDSDGREVHGKILKQNLVGKGYDKVALMKDGKYKNELVHRLVAKAFKPEADAKSLQVSHRNEKKDDNHSSNLEWQTKERNENEKI